MSSATVLHDVPLSPRVRLAGLWASLMFCFVYGDYFELYRPGKLASMQDGHIGAWDVSQGVLVGTGILMLIPSLMTAATLTLPAAVARVANVISGLLYALVMALVIPGTWHFYVMYGLVEIALCVGIVGLALRWPRSTQVHG